MKFSTKKVAMALVLMGFTYSSNVVYEYQTGQSFFRSIASVVESSEIEAVTAENFSLRYDKAKEHLDSLKLKHADLDSKISASNKEESTQTLAEIESFLEERKLLKEELKRLKEQARKQESELAESNSDQLNSEIIAPVPSDSIDIAEKELELELSLSLSEDQIKEIKYLSQQNEIDLQNKKIDSIGTKLCDQNKSISDLVSKIEKLIEDKEKVVAASEEDSDEDKDEDKEESRSFALDFPFMMDPSMFFSQMNPSSMFSESAGIDPNFLLLSQMIKPGIPGFGGSTNLYYSPTYNQEYAPQMPMISANGGTNILGQNLNSDFLRPEYPQYIPQTVRPKGSFDFIQLPN
tara:strand:- start:67052 stop:68098 length:1047 start_codon:yes stop_codon:yes gene_type:complete